MAVPIKNCHAMTTYYQKIYKQKYKKEPSLNRYAARWGFDSVLHDLNMEETKELLDYYLTTNNKHDLDFFFYNYHKLKTAMERNVDDKQHRANLMEESQRRAEEWRKSGKQSITDH